MKHIHKLTTLACATLVLSGCGTFFGKDGYIRDKGGDYINEEVSPALVIPPSLSAVQSTEYMVIPDISSHVKPAEGDVVPRADRRVVRDDGDAYQIVSGLGGRHLIAERAPDKVWSQLVRFWEANDISLAAQHPSSGVMETDWVQINGTSNPGLMRRMVGRVIDLENAQDNQEKFLVRVSQGVRAGTSDVQLLHARRATDADLTAPVNWNTITDSASDSLENGMLNEMLVFMVQHHEEQSVSLSAKDLGVGDQSSLIRDGNGNPVLKIDKDFARSWQAVEVALNSSGIKVQDKNRSAGLIFINLPSELNGQAEEKKDSGWFGGLFGGSSDNDENGMEEYRIRVQSVGHATHISLEKSLETLPPEELTMKFLERLRDNLS